MHLAGLLAYPAFDNLPVPTTVGKQWFKKDQKLNGTYSIGECSGLSPDSRFNPDDCRGPMHVWKIGGGYLKSKFVSEFRVMYQPNF